MRFDIDSGKLLYALGVVFDLSITVKAALLLLAFVAFLVAGLTLQRDVLDAVAVALAGVTYVVVRYEPSETGIFLLLALSAGLFVSLGDALRERNLTVPRWRATTVVARTATSSGTGRRSSRWVGTTPGSTSRPGASRDTACSRRCPSGCPSRSSGRERSRSRAVERR